MKRGVWIVEGRMRPDIAGESQWQRFEFHADEGAANEAVGVLNRSPRWEYRAARYVPAAELTRKPRKRRKP